METITDIDKLRFYREEIKHEFGLLAMRSTILVTCQSFLVVPFAILNTAADFRTVVIAVYLVAALGIFVALILIPPITASHRTINKWLLKQRELIRGSEKLQQLAIDRDTIPGVEKDLHKDVEHTRSLTFSLYSPMAFFLFWVLAVIFSCFRAYF